MIINKTIIFFYYKNVNLWSLFFRFLNFILWFCFLKKYKNVTFLLSCMVLENFGAKKLKKGQKKGKIYPFHGQKGCQK